ncbi:S1C family serine protease [Saccharibacillus kuerlensis]|uniref:Serine protease n=1 Tax=Saccharibacillus kuerlensis TaxID=459527 RepID=A0ABQ2L2U8_9BACL|nr:S1C family serine protease [Saccharibacillus kuerlensis]GGO00663.1 hypothetical protein GCM10010969_22130 [Saccharibacillus kuerlensis]
MKKQALVSVIVSAAVLIAGSAGSYAIHRSYSVNGGEGALLAGTGELSTDPGSRAGRDSASSAERDIGSEVDTEEKAAEAEGVGDAVSDGEQSGRTLKEIISSVGEKVVMIETADGSIGSGFLYNDQGDILTNAHVVSGFKNVTVTVSDLGQLSGRVIGIGEETDVAVVRVSDLAGVEPLELKLNAEAEIGDEVLAMGSPLGLQNTVTTGIVSGVDRTFDIEPYYYEGLYQISAPIAPGNSGGPLVDRATGQVLGINSAVSDEGGIGFSIPVVNIVDSARNWSQDPMEVLPDPDRGYDAYGNLESDDGEIADDYDSGEYAEATELEYAAEDVLYDFYEALALRDYRSAYKWLGPDWQKRQSYEDFAAEYKNTLGVYLDYCVGVENMDGTVSVYVSLTADERVQDDAEAVVYNWVYQVGREAEGASGSLVILSAEPQDE